MPADTFIVAGEATIGWYRGKYFKRTPASNGLTIGAPVFEPAGVANRRGFVCHPLDPDQLSYAQAVVANNVATGVHANDVLFLPALPVDWRYPPPLLTARRTPRRR